MKRRILSGLLIAAMMTGTLAGCGAKDTGNGSQGAVKGTETAEGEASDINFDEDPYEVNMLFALPAASPNDSEVKRVTDKINEITLENLNMTLNLTILPFSAYLEQIQLDLSSGADLDIFVAPTAYGPSWVDAGFLTDMGPLLEQYGQETLESYPSKELATAPNLNGYVYGVPVHKEISQQTSIYFRTDILDKYNIDVSNVKTIEDVDTIFDEVSAKEPDMWMVAMDNLGWPELEPMDYIGGLETYTVLDPTENSTVENVFETDVFKKWTTYAHKWFDKGWINSGAASDTESYYTYISSGQAFAFFNDSGHPLAEKDQESNCGGTDLTMVNLEESIATTATASAFCYCISSGSEDPAKAMQMLNFIETNTDVMNLLNWGVEGEDYVVNSDGLLDYPEGKDASTVGYHVGAGWILPNQFVCTPWCTDGADIYEKMEEYNNNTTISQLMGFTFDPTPVQDQISAVSNVRAKYYKALVTGAVDPDEYIEKLVQEMKDAGSEEIIAEMQKQVDEFLQNKSE